MIIKVKGKMKNLKNRLSKKKIKQKGGSKRCWCGKPALRSGYCPDHLQKIGGELYTRLLFIIKNIMNTNTKVISLS